MPINRKLTVLILLTCVFALTLAGTSMIVIEWVSSRKTMVENMTVMADLLGRYSTAALTFHREEDQEEIDRVLQAVQADPSVIAVCVYDRDQHRFGQYLTPRAGRPFPDSPPADGHRFIDSTLELASPILRENNRIGTLYLRADLRRIYDHLTLDAGIVGLVLLAIICMAFLLSSSLRRFVTAPVLALADVARHVAEKKDYSIRAGAGAGGRGGSRAGEAGRGGGGGGGGRRDEVGLLTDAVNQMLGEIEARQSSLQRANQSLEGQAREIAQSIGVLSSSSGEILATSTELAAGAAQTAASVRQTTAVLDNVKETALATSDLANSVAKSAQTVVEVSLNGKKSVEETIRGMDHIRRQVESIADSMVRLCEQTQAIDQILGTVDDLAVQSNLLAVNASIEASKAGEHGRGFMVVAHEVRNLAEQSREATKHVRNILIAVQKATAAAVMATEQGSKAVRQGVELSGQSGTSIDALSRSVTEAAQAAARIADSSLRQLAGTDQVASAMISILQASTHNASSAKQLESAAHNLKTLGERLLQTSTQNPPRPGGPPQD
jgi:methyl-accepting chemotaxis protein